MTDLRGGLVSAADQAPFGSACAVKGTPGLQALHEARDAAARELAAAIQRVIPAGFRGHITAWVDSGVVRAQDIVIELRLPQKKP